MQPAISVHFSGGVAEDAGAALRDGMPARLAEALSEWAPGGLARRFTAEGRAEYGYAARSRYYRRMAEKRGYSGVFESPYSRRPKMRDTVPVPGVGHRVEVMGDAAVMIAAGARAINFAGTDGKRRAGRRASLAIDVYREEWRTLHPAEVRSLLAVAQPRIIALMAQSLRGPGDG